MPYNPEKAEEGQRRKRKRILLWVLVAILVALLVAAGVYFYERYGQGGGASSPAEMTAPMAASSSANTGQPGIGTVAHPQHPIPSKADTEGKGRSNSGATESSSFQEALMQALGKTSVDNGNGEQAAPLSSFLISTGLIRRIVTTVDDLGRHTSIPARVRPVPPVRGSLAVQKSESSVALSADNAARYQPFVKAIGGLNMQHVAAAYFRYYPAFQKAYEQLGFPNRYFNDRVIQVIDLMLAAPHVSPPVTLVPYKGNYRFADPALEALPAGQKLMIRIGPQNAATLRTKLQELRAALVAGDSDTPASSADAKQP